jgi:hypothetical protein
MITQSFMPHHDGQVGALLEPPDADAKEKILCASMVTGRDF